MGKFMELFIQKETPEIGLSASQANENDVEEAELKTGTVICGESESDEDILNDAYREGNLASNTGGIFKVRDMLNTLPDEMTTAKKQKVIEGMLSVIGEDAGSLKDDGISRIACVEDAIQQWNSITEQIVKGAEADIEELKNLIEAAQKKIVEANGGHDHAIKILNSEKATIEHLTEFVEGIINAAE